jgi:hypothetical protein
LKDLFRKNIGPLDRVLRLSFGMVLLVLGILAEEGRTGTIFILVSIPLFLSGMTGICPTYSLLGISTKRIKNTPVDRP